MEKKNQTQADSDQMLKKKVDQEKKN